MPAHSALTGADLHEPKGAASASANTVYVADGAGSGAWSKIDSDNVDTTSIKNVNKFKLLYKMIDIGTVKSEYIPLSDACTLTGVRVRVQSSPTTSNTVLTFKNAGSTTIGTVSVTAAASAGTEFTLTPASNNSFSANSFLQIDSDGGAANTPDVIIMLDFTYN